MDALIFVDIQSDFVPGGALPVPHGREVVAVANRLVPAFDLIVATQDWHGPQHASFASAHPGKSVGECIDLHGVPQVLWPDHCVRGTAGAAFVAELDTARLARVFRKGTDDDVDSYSGFFDGDRRHSTGLAEFLRERGVSDVYVLGLATDYCVKATALDAIDLGFTTYLVVDGCRGVDIMGDTRRAVEEMAARGVCVFTSTDLLPRAAGATARRI